MFPSLPTPLTRPSLDILELPDLQEYTAKSIFDEDILLAK